MKRLLFIVGLALGYVLGARAGRASYERIRSRAQGVWSDPKVQKGLHDTQEFVKDKAPVVAGKVKDAATSAAGAVQSKVASAGSDSGSTKDSGSTEDAGSTEHIGSTSAGGSADASAPSAPGSDTPAPGTPSPDAV